MISKTPDATDPKWWNNASMHPNYQKKREMFVHIFEPLRTVLRHLDSVFVCMMHRVRDEIESILK